MVEERIERDGLAALIRQFKRDFRNYHADFCRWKHGSLDAGSRAHNGRGLALEQDRTGLALTARLLSDRLKSRALRELAQSLEIPGNVKAGDDYAQHWQPVVADLDAQNDIP